MRSLHDILFREATIIYRRRRWAPKPSRVPDPNLAVYIITFEDRLDFTAFKIGVSNNVKRRLDTLQTGCPWRLQVGAVIYRPDAYEFEKYLHGVYRKYRIRPDGEWFDFGPGVNPVDIVTGGRVL